MKWNIINQEIELYEISGFDSLRHRCYFYVYKSIIEYFPLNVNMILQFHRKRGVFMLLEKIKVLCSQRNITVSELERILEFGNGTMHKWGKSQPSADKVLKVAEYFGVSLDYLFSGKELLSKESLDLANQFERFSDEQKNLIRIYLSMVGARKVG